MVQPSDARGRGVEKIGTHLAQIVIADPASVRCALLRQPADQCACAHLRGGGEPCASVFVVVVEVGIRGRAGRAQAAARCATWVRGSCLSPHGAAEGSSARRYFLVSKSGSTSHSAATGVCGENLKSAKNSNAHDHEDSNERKVCTCTSLSSKLKFL